MAAVQSYVNYGTSETVSASERFSCFLYIVRSGGMVSRTICPRNPLCEPHLVLDVFAQSDAGAGTALPWLMGILGTSDRLIAYILYWLLTIVGSQDFTVSLSVQPPHFAIDGRRQPARCLRSRLKLNRTLLIH